MALSKVNPNFVSQNLGRRNLIINGDMTVAQRATSATGVGASNGYFTLDRWNFTTSTTGRFTMSQSTDAPIGFSKSMKIDCTTADTSIAAGEYSILTQAIEAQDIKSMARGTSGAKEVTVSFYVKGTAATYVCEMQDESSRELSKTFNVTTAWERVELTFPADTNVAAATTYDNTAGIYLYFWIQAGTNFKGGTIPTTWASQTNTDRTTGISNFFSSTSNELYITGVQLEVGSVATDFEHRSYGAELALCQRYFERRSYTGSAVVTIGTAYHATHCMAGMNFMEKRAIPSITMPACSEAGFSFLDSTASYPSNHGTMVVAGSTISKNNFRFASNNGAGHTAGDATWVHSGGTNHIDIDSEL